MSILETFDPRRAGLITASRCSPLVPKKSAEVGQKTLARQLANEMFFKFNDEQGSWQTEHGKNCEPMALVFLQDNYDKSAHKPEFVCKGYWGASGDVLTDSTGYDIKCPTTMEKWLEYLQVGISDEQFNQCQMSAHLYKRPSWNIAAYLVETMKMSDSGIKYPVPEHQRMILFKVPKDDSWLETLTKNTPTVITMRDFYYNKLVQHFTT